MRHTTKQIETPLLTWIVWRVTQAIGAMKPRYVAAEAAAVVAMSGNPSGA